MVWTMDQKVLGEQSLKQLERPSVIPLCIHLRQHVAINTCNKSLGKLVCGHLAPRRNRASRMQLLKHCLQSPQAEPIMEPPDSVTFSVSSAFWHETLCMCMCVHNPLPNTVHPAGLVHLTKKSTQLCHVISCSFSPTRSCYYQKIEVILLQISQVSSSLSLFVRENFFLHLNVNLNLLHVKVSALDNFSFLC